MQILHKYCFEVPFTNKKWNRYSFDLLKRLNSDNRNRSFKNTSKFQATTTVWHSKEHFIISRLDFTWDQSYSIVLIFRLSWQSENIHSTLGNYRLWDPRLKILYLLQNSPNLFDFPDLQNSQQISKWKIQTESI